MPQPKIYLDLHGVLANFVDAAFRLHGRTRGPGDAASFNWFRDEWRMSLKDFWFPINGAGWRWWAELDAYPWSEDLVALVTRLDPAWRLLSAPARHGSSAAGTMTLAYRRYNLPTSRIFLATAKSELAAPGRLLIDDNADNCRLWNAAGGRAVLFPQPWNGSDATDTERLPRVAAAIEDALRAMEQDLLAAA